MADSIETRVMAAIAKLHYVDPNRIFPGATFEDLGMTSLDALALVTELEEEFNIEIPNEQAMGLSTVGEAIECIQKLAPDAEAEAAG